MTGGARTERRSDSACAFTNYSLNYLTIMKKKTIFLLGLLLGTMAGHAQLVVNSNGSVEAGTSSTLW